MAYAVREVGFSVSGSGPQNPGLPAHQIPGAAIKRIGLVTTIWACWLHAWAFSVLRHGRRRTLVPTFFGSFLTAREPWVIWLQLRQPVGLPLGPVFSCGQRRPLWPADAPIGLLLLAAFFPLHLRYWFHGGCLRRTGFFALLCGRPARLRVYRPGRELGCSCCHIDRHSGR